MRLISRRVCVAAGAGVVRCCSRSRNNQTDRFDMLVRADFFAGFAGDRDQLTKHGCMREGVTGNPSHAEALVTSTAPAWHFRLARPSLPASRRRMDLWTTGMRELDRPLNRPLGGRADSARGHAADGDTCNIPPEMAALLLKSALANYERVLGTSVVAGLQLGDHAKRRRDSLKAMRGLAT